MANQTRHFLLDQPDLDEWARAVRADGTSVTFEHRVGRRSLLALPVPARDVSIEFRWIDDFGSSIPGFVALRSAIDVVNMSGLCRFEVGGGGAIRPWVKTSGAVVFAELLVHNADFRAEPDTIELRLRLDAGSDARLSGVVLGNLSVNLERGESQMRAENGAVVVQQMTNGSIARYREDQVLDVQGHLTDSLLKDLSVEVQDGARLERCQGAIRVRHCRGTILGSSGPGRHLVLASEFGGEAKPAEALKGAVLMDIAIDPNSVGAFVASSEDARVLDPLAATIPESFDGLATDERAAAAELLHDRLEELAKRPSTVDAAAITVLELRRSAARRFGLDWTLLTLAWMFGYGRRIARPLIVWGTVITAILAFRVGAAINRPAGEIRWRDGLEVVHLSNAFEIAGDVLFTTLLLPISWSNGSSNADVSERVGVSGGYLIALRMLLLISLLAAASAARRRIRVRPSTNRK